MRLRFLFLPAGSPMGVSLWDFSFCITEPDTRLKHRLPPTAHCLPPGRCSKGPTPPHPNSPSGSHTAPAHRHPCLGVSTLGCKGGGRGYSPCQNSHISFSSFSFSDLPPAGNTSYHNKKEGPKQAQLGPLGFHWPLGVAQTPVSRVG